MDIAIIPKMLLDMLEHDPERQVHLNVLLSALFLLLAAALLSHHGNALALLPHVCLAQTLCGISCPGCGVTGSALAFLAGDVSRAWTINPAGPVLCVSVGCRIPLRLLALSGTRGKSPALTTSRVMTSAVVTVLFLNWLGHIF